MIMTWSPCYFARRLSAMQYVSATARLSNRRGSRSISSCVPQFVTYTNASKYSSIRARGSPLKSPHV